VSVDDCLRTAIGDGADPSGVPWAELAPEVLRGRRTSVKWRRFEPDVLPMFVAEMDFAIAPEVRAVLVSAIEASDVGYLDGPGELAPVFAAFVNDRWGWQVNPAHVHLATDVATGVVEALRVLRPDGGPLVLPTPTYPGFFEMLTELPFEVREVALDVTGGVAGGVAASLDLGAIEREFSQGATAFILCNPHNPHGVAFTHSEIAALASLAAKYDVCVVSDEIHAPLTHSGATFTPFAPLAAAAGALSATVTSASKGWNIAAAKCAVIVAADERANEVLNTLPPEVVTRTSILGLLASIAAFTDGRDWLDRIIAQIEANQALFAALVDERLPGVHYTPGHAGYLGWIDFRDAGLGEHPVKPVLKEARVAFNDGRHFGLGGDGFARINLAAAPDTIVRGVDRIANLLVAAKGNQA
jgi:cystathionine beta-lyase